MKNTNEHHKDDKELQNIDTDKQDEYTLSSKGQGLINWISGRVPGETEKEGGDQAFLSQPQKLGSQRSIDKL